MIPMNSPPTQMTIPFGATGEVTRRLVLRNPLDNETLVTKFVVDQPIAQAVRLSQDYVRIPPKNIAYVQALVDGSELCPCDHKIKGYVRIEKEPEASVQWLTAPGAQKEKQLAFSLAVRSSHEFSPHDTVIDLPGNAGLVEDAAMENFGSDYTGTEETLAEEGTAPGKPFSSYFGFDVESSYISPEFNGVAS